MLPWASTLLMVLRWSGIQQKWWRRLEDTPLFQRASDADGLVVEGGQAEGGSENAPAQAPPVAVGGDQAGKSAARSNTRLENMRQSAKNTMHFAASWLAQRKRRCLWCVMSGLEEPLRVQCGERLVMQQTRRGNRERFRQLVIGGYREEFCRVFGILGDAGELRRFEFGSVLHFGDDPSPGELHQDDEVITAAFEFACELVRARLLSLMSHSHTLPGLFAAILYIPEGGDNPYEQLQQCWETLEALEKGCDAERERLDFVWGLIFPLMHWVRELLVLLLEKASGRLGMTFRVRSGGGSMGL